MKEEVDEVLYEIPVQLNKKLVDKLFIVQHALKFPQPDQIDQFVGSCAIKTNQPAFKIDVKSDVIPDTYSLSKAEEFAVKLNDANVMKKKPDTTYKQINELNTHTYEARELHASKQFAVGYLHENELVLTPIKGIFQLKSNADYLDVIDKREKSMKKTDDSGEESDADTNEPEKIQVKFASNPNQDRAKRPVTYSQHVQKIAEDPWVMKTWRGSQSAESESQRLELIASSNTTENETDEITSLPLSKTDYFKTIVDTKAEDEDEVDEQSLLSLHEVQSMSLLEKCRLIMKRTKIIEFDDAMKLLRLKLTQKAELLKALQQSAFLVKGVWIIKSELLFNKNGFSFDHGLTSERMCTVRDYVLYLFKTKEYVCRKEVLNVYDISTTELDRILNEIADYVPKMGWKLKVVARINAK